MKKRNIILMFGGMAVMAGVSLGLAALFGAVFAGGMLPTGAMEGVSWGITLVAALAGAFWISRRTEKGPLPMSLCVGIVYFLIIFTCRGIFFRQVGDDLLILLGCGFLGLVLGAFLAAGSQNKGRKRRNVLK